MEKKTKAVQKEVVITAKRQFEGEVVSVSGSKTVSVRVDRMKIHPKYNKQYKQSTKFAVHDEKGIAKVGNIVVIEECRPLSKSKRWFLVSIVK
jgi:small subunit ribosomal protein S17